MPVAAAATTASYFATSVRLDAARPIQWYRHLLREARRLPSLRARTYFEHYIRLRFRRLAERAQPVSPDRWPLLHRQARQGLSLLRRANAGVLQPLHRVLALAYGRSGKRRHELLEQVKSGPFLDRGSTHPDTITATLHSYPTKLSEELDRQVPRFTAPLEALYQSQKKQNQDVFDKAHAIKSHAGPKIPAVNAWRRSLPAKRVKNIARQWYRATVRRIWAPLPEDEAAELLALAQSSPGVDGRPAPLLQPLSALDVVLGLAPAPAKVHAGRLSHPHRLTARFMRRRYGAILRHSPVIKPTVDQVGYCVSWPKHRHATKTLPRDEYLAKLKLFDELD